MGDERNFDAFLSYSHSADEEDSAPKLQRLIRRVGRPWYRRGSLLIFRDRTDLLMSASLWGTIEDALRRSHHFILLASPGAAASPWVRREVEHWLEHHGPDTMIIVHTAGDIEWDEVGHDFRWDRTTALPRVLAGRFPDVPNWGSVAARPGDRRRDREDRFRDVARTIAARLYDVPKSTLDGEDERELRRARRTRRGGIAALALLAVIAVVAGVLAVVRGGEATAQATIALSRELAAASDEQLATNVDVANLVAVRAFRTDRNPQTRAALFRAVTASGPLVRYLPFDATVVRLAGSGDGTAVVVGLQDGRVLRWRLAAPAPEEVFRLPSPAVSLSVSDRGDLVAASDRATTLIARAGREPASVSPPDGGHVDAVAVSPSGRTTVITGSDDELVERRFTSLFTEDLTRTDHGGLSERADTVVTTDDHVLLLDGAHGEWERRSVADWSLLAGSRIGFGVSNHGHAVSADGGFLTYTNGSGTIPVWGADRPSDHDTPPRTARAPIAEPLAITLNADATRLAVAEDATIFVSRVREAGAVPEDPVRLTGADHVNTDGLRFLGTGGQKLVSAAGSRVVLWDLDQTDRIGRAAPVPVSAGCSGCGPPTLAVSPDGARLVAFDGAGVAGVAGPLDAVGRLPALTFSGRYGPAVWDRDGRRVTVLVVPPAGGTTAPVPAGLPDFVRAVSAGERSSEVLDAALSSDGAHVVAVQQDGGIDVVDLATGTVQAVTEPPTAPKPPDVAVAAAGPDLVAVVAGDAVVVREALTGQEVGRLAATDVGFLEFAPGRLLVQRTSGELEVWDDRLTERRQVIAGDPGFVRPPVANADGTLVARVRADGTVVLVDLETGTPVASLAAGPPGRRVGVGFSADGDHLVTVTEGDGLDLGSAVSRTLSAEAMVLAACRTAGRDLTPTEWRALVDAEPPDDLRCR